MARIGHASPRAALIYQHATRERDVVIARALDGIIRDVLGRGSERVADVAQIVNAKALHAKPLRGRVPTDAARLVSPEAFGGSRGWIPDATNAHEAEYPLPDRRADIRGVYRWWDSVRRQA